MKPAKKSDGKPIRPTAPYNAVGSPAALAARAECDKLTEAVKAARLAEARAEGRMLRSFHRWEKARKKSCRLEKKLLKLSV